MTRDQLREMGITDDAHIKAILDAHGKEVSAAKSSTDVEAYKTEIEKLKTEHANALKALHDKLSASESSVTALTGKVDELSKAGEIGEKALADLDALRKQMDDERAEREAKEAADRLDREMRSRFDAISGDKKFVNDLTRDGVYGQFKAALADDTYKGKGDAEIYAALTTDKEGYFANPNPPADGAPIKSIGDTGQKPSIPTIF